MAHRMHRVGAYDYSIDAGLGEPGRLRLWAPDGHQLAQLGFVADDTAVPSPRIAADLSSAAAFIKCGTLAVLIDMLRNEQPVYVTFDDGPPGFVLVHTRKKRRRAEKEQP